MSRLTGFKFYLITSLVLLVMMGLLVSCGSPAPAPAPTTAPKPAAPVAAPSQAPVASPTPAKAPVPAPAASGVYTAANPFTVSIVIHDLNMSNMHQAMRAVLPLAEKKSEGRLKFKILGGTEVIDGQQQFEACRNGVVDSVWGPSGYFLGTAPAGEALYLDMASAKDRRASGLDDLFNQYLQTKGLYHLMMANNSASKGGDYGIFVNGKVSKPEDLKGLKIRATGTFAPWVKSFGAVAVNIPSGEIYTAMQNGVVVGCTQPVDKLFFTRALYEVVHNYIVPFVGKNPIIWGVNLNKWNAMPPDLQKILKEAIIEIENDPAWLKTMADISVGWEEQFQAKGMKPIEFDKDLVRSAFAKGIWDAVMKGDATWGAKLKALIDAQPK